MTFATTNRAAGRTGCRVLMVRRFRHAKRPSAALLCVVSATASAQPQVTLTGGSDLSGHNYAWTITHQHSAPLVFVEIPHYRGDLFFAPDGWSTEIINQNSLDYKPGKCIAKTMEQSGGLPRDQSAEFRLRINPAGALQKPGTILLRFADGAEVALPTEVPGRQSSTEHYALPVSLAAIFVAYLVFGYFKKRKTKQS